MGRFTVQTYKTNLIDPSMLISNTPKCSILRYSTYIPPWYILENIFSSARWHSGITLIWLKMVWHILVQHDRNHFWQWGRGCFFFLLFFYYFNLIFWKKGRFPPSSLELESVQETKHRDICNPVSVQAGKWFPRRNTRPTTIVWTWLLGYKYKELLLGNCLSPTLKFFVHFPGKVEDSRTMCTN